MSKQQKILLSLSELVTNNPMIVYELEANSWPVPKQVPRGYIVCDYFIVTHCIIDYDII